MTQTKDTFGEKEPPIRILFVEDSPEDLKLILQELKSGGILPVYARVDREGEFRTALEGGGWDVILCDYTMPNFSGLRALEIVRELRLDLPFIVVSGTIGEETAVDAMLKGAHDYILKDRLVRLVPAVRRELGAFQNRELQKETESQLLHLQKMDAVGRLAGGIAHDFNNMLAAIGLNCDLALSEAGSNEEVKATIGEIKRIGERAAALTRQLLLFSRKQPNRPRSLRLNDLVVEIEKMLGRLIGESVELEVKLSRESGFVLIDPSQLEQVIVNLAVNARDAMPSGGVLTIETLNAEIGNADAVGALPVEAGSYVVLKVSDTGTGMADETVARIFEPFFTTKPIGKGTGLGLSTAYGVIKDSRGTIAVSSTPSEGTEFSVYLPRVESAVEEPLPEATAGLGGDGTILLVEDDEYLRDLCVRILEKEGFEVLSATNGKEALSLCEDGSRTIDLLVTDVAMPEIHGFELASRALKLREGLRVLFMSGYIENSVQAGSAFAGVEVNLIEKPFSSAALVAKVKAVLAVPATLTASVS
jgi:signal transduction histidine kinase